VRRPHAATRPLSAEIHRIAENDRGFLAISSLLDSAGNDIVLSRYEDNVWDLSPYVRAINLNRSDLRIDFSAISENGESLLSPPHTALLSGAKEFIYVRWMFKSAISGKHLKARGVIADWHGLRQLIRWMMDQGMGSFRELTPDQASTYLRTVIDHRIAGGYSKRHRMRSVSVIQTMYHSRAMLTDAPRHHPWPDSGVGIELGFGRLTGDRDATTEIVPHQLLCRLGTYAFDYIGQHSSRLLSVWLELDREAEIVYEAMLRLDGANNRFRWGRSDLRGCDAMQGAFTRRMQDAARPIVRRHGYSYGKDLIFDIDHLRTCCYVVTAMFSGMRDSEVSALREGCFTRSVGFDDDEYHWVEGTTFKLEQDPRPAKWMVPAIVGDAIKCAQQISAPMRRRLKQILRMLDDDLAIADDKSKANIAVAKANIQKLDGAIFLRTSNLGFYPLPILNSSNNLSLKNMSVAAGLVVGPEDMKDVLNKKRITQGCLWPLSSHQFRRTFAVFVARNLLGDARYLRHHFKHWSIDMTLHYASDPSLDDTVFSEIISSRDELQADLIAGWITQTQRLTGGRASQVVRFRERNAVKTAKDARDLSRSIGDGVFVRGTGHSWCLAENEGCGGEGLYDAIRCVDCGESLIDESHITVWRAIRAQQLELVNHTDLGVPGKARAQKHLDAANAVLRELDPAGDRNDDEA
jgi:hypothetical protein